MAIEDMADETNESGDFYEDIYYFEDDEIDEELKEARQEDLDQDLSPEQLEQRIEKLENNIIDQSQKIKPIDSLDKVPESVIANHELYELVKLIQFWDGNMIREFKNIAHAWISGVQYEKERKASEGGKK